jgi:putative pyruvate formate lyase activating enzyme
MYQPAYIDLYNSGELTFKIKELEKAMQNCDLCPHFCFTDRFIKGSGKCKTKALPVLSSAGPHFGEEPPLVGFYGSGTLFMTSCNLHCKFCQNYDISQLNFGRELSYQELSETMIELQKKGCHNINFVTPTHQVYAIMKALELAVPLGLNIPLVYNSGGYDLVSTLKLLRGIFDIYMPDFKYFYQETAEKLSGAGNYPEVAIAAILEMHSQVGDLETDPSGIARRGLIVRHLVLPGHIEESTRVIDFLSNHLPHTYFNLMDQYRPEFRALEDPELNRRLNSEEYRKLFNYATKAGLHLAE